MKAVIFAAALVLAFPGLSLADASSQADGLAWLKKVAAAAHQLNYSGTYIYQAGDRVETSKITHLHDDTGEHEKLESLEGNPREIIRNNNEVLCFKPESNDSIVVEKRRTEKSFPAMLPRQLGGIADNYRIVLAEQDRAAGYPCQVIMLEPKDQFRYRLKLWVDPGSGLLLKATTLNEKNDAVAQFAFTQISIGGQIDKEALKPKLSGKKVFLSNEPPPKVELLPNESVWTVKQLPPGFGQVTVTRRTMPGKEMPVKHLVFSDGLATISVFIEPLAAGTKPVQGAGRQGAINVYTRLVADHQVTVLGEVPAVTVMQVANSVTRN